MAPDPQSTESREEWLGLLYERVTDQFSLTRESLHNTNTWALTLTVAVVGAILTTGQWLASERYPNEITLVALLAIAPIGVRLFIRACLENSIQYRWLELRDALDKYYYVRRFRPDLVRQAEENLYQVIKLYYFQWKSPKRLRFIIWENLRLTFLWPGTLLAASIIWGLFGVLGWVSPKVEISPLISVVTVSSVGFILWEVWSLTQYSGFEEAQPQTPMPDIE